MFFLKKLKFLFVSLQFSIVQVAACLNKTFRTMASMGSTSVVASMHHKDILKSPRTEGYSRDRENDIVFEQAAIGIAYIAANGRWLQVNQKLCDIVGYSREELLEKSFQDITHPDDLPASLERFRRLQAGEIQTCSLEKRYFHKSGRLVWTNVTVSVVHGDADVIVHQIAFVEDITARKQAEAERIDLLQREQTARTEAEAVTLRLETMLETMAEAVLVYDREGKIIFASTTAQEIFPLNVWPEHASLPPEERAAHYMLRDESGQPIPPDRSPVHRLLHGEILKGATALDVIVRARNGNELHLSLSGSPMYDAQRTITGAVIIARDVTERRNLELRTRKALEGMLEMARALVQLPESADGLDIVGRQLAELTCHVLNCRRVGVVVIEPETEIPRPIAVVGLSPEQEEQWWEEQRQQEISLNDSPTPELVALLRANEVLVIDMTQPPFSDQPNPYNINVMLAVPMCIGESLIGILTLDYGDDTHHQYKEEDIALASAVAQLSALVIERQRLLSERAASQGRELALREANVRMEEFLGIASHELRTPLTTIKANVQLAMRRLRSINQGADVITDGVLGKVEAAQNMLERAERQISVLNRLVSDMVDISRIQSNKLQLHLRQEPCNLITLVQEVIQEQRKTSPERIITLRIPSDTMIPVIVDHDRITQVLTNYLSNALKYSLADRPVRVWVELMEQQARVLVQDEGPGLSSEEQKQVWECFYQAPGVKVLSGSGVGLGLGLHISRTIIERHHGQVGVESKRGEGSTFWFTLPLASTDIHRL